MLIPLGALYEYMKQRKKSIFAIFQKWTYPVTYDFPEMCLRHP